MAKIKPNSKTCEVLRYIRDYMATETWSPTYDEISHAFNWKSNSTSYYHANRLFKAGYLDIKDNGYAMRLTEKGRDYLEQSNVVGKPIRKPIQLVQEVG